MAGLSNRLFKTTVSMIGLMFFLVSIFIAINVNNVYAAKKKEKYKIFLSLSYSGNVWQRSAANVVKALAKTPPYDKIVDLTEVISGLDPQDQISDYQSMIAQGANGIISFPVSPTALNRVIEQGSKQGVLFFMYDSTVTAPSAYNVSYITAGHGENVAQYLVNLMGGKGNVMIDRGVPGNTVDMRHALGMKAIFDQYPKIKVVDEYYGYWDDAKSQKKTSEALAAHPDVDGIACQLGEYGVLRACLAAKLDKLPYIVGEDTNGIRLAFADPELQKKGLKGVSAGSPPATAGYAFKLMMEVLQEKRELPFHDIQYPLPWVEWDKIDECDEDEIWYMGAPANADTCNAFSKEEVSPTMTDEVLHSEFLPELDLNSALTGEAKPGATIQPLPWEVKQARPEPGINCDPQKEKCVDPEYVPYMVSPIPAP